ncbi:MAG: sugar phosphate isomerase/epimerase family protein [Victivallaceae bacterium]
MIKFATAITSLNLACTSELAAAFNDSKLKNLEINTTRVNEPDNNDGSGLNRAKWMKLVKSGVVNCPSLHLPFGEGWDLSVADEAMRLATVKRFSDHIEKNLDFGAWHLTLHAGCEPIKTEEHAMRLEQARRSVAELLPVLRKHNLKMSIEYLPRTCIGNSVADLRYLTNGVDPQYVDILLDVNHVMDQAEKLPQIISQLADRLGACHFSDYDNVDECHWIPGRGVIDWPQLMAALKQTGRDLLIIFETRIPASEGDGVTALQLLNQCMNDLDKMYANA